MKTKIEIITPQFEREPGATPPADMASIEFDALRKLPKDALEALGMKAWNDPDEPGNPFPGKVLMLFPGEWYGRIPDDYEVVTIMGVRKKFVRGQSDDDIRFGVLAYGILVSP